MPAGPVFPAFLKLEYRDDGSAKGAFLAAVDSTLNSAERRFAEFGKEAGRQLDAALATQRTPTGALDLNVAGQRAAADAARARAVAARELAVATATAARENGDFSQSTRLAVAALQAQAREEDQAAAAALSHARALEQVQGVLNRQASAVTAVTGATRRSAAVNDNFTASAGQQRAAMQQLSFQLGDVSQGFALGTPPAIIFAQQIGQVTQAVQLMGGGGALGGVARFLGGPWGIALASAAVVLAPFIGRLFETKAAADAVTFSSHSLGDAQGILGSIVDITSGKIENQSVALIALARAQALAGQIKARSDIANARSELGGLAASRTSIGSGFGGGLTIRRGRDATGDIASGLLDGSLNPAEAVAGLNSLQRAGIATEKSFLEAAQAATKLGVAAENLKAFQSADRLITGQGTAADRALLLKPTRGGGSSRKTGGGDGGGGSSRARELSEEEQAFKQATAAAQSYLDRLGEEAARLGKTAIETKRLEVAQQVAAAPTAALARLIANQADNLERLNRVQADSDFQRNVIAPLDRELKLRGLTGTARDKAALALEEETFRADALARGLTDVNQAWGEYFKRKGQILETEGLLDRERRDAEALANILGEISGLFGSFGKGGRLVAGFADVLNPTSSIGRILSRTDEETARQIKLLTDSLDKTFGIGGSFGGLLAGALAGANTGATVAGAFGQSQRTGAAIGAVLQLAGASNPAIAAYTAATAVANTIGPVIGNALGLKYSKTGGAIGGLAGGFVGGLFKKTPRSSATIGGRGDELDITGSSGSSGKLRRASEGAAGDAISAVQRIAEALGATIDASRGSVSLGIRNGNYRLDTTGSGITKTSKGAIDFGKDGAEAAIRAAALDLVQDGIITGLKAGTQRLLQSGKDLDSALQKAVDFEGALSRAKALTDPVGATLDTLNREFGRLKTIFGEAGASAEEYASLEKLYGAERAKAIKAATDSIAGSLRGLYSHLTIGDDARSLRDRKAAAQSVYDPLAARVAAGDTTAFDSYADAARALLDIQRQFSGSQTGYFELADSIASISKARLDELGAVAAASTGRDSPFSNSSVPIRDNQGVIDAVNDQTGELGAKLDAVNQNLGAMLALTGRGDQPLLQSRGYF